MSLTDPIKFWRILDHLNIPLHEAVPQVAALLYLRWIDCQGTKSDRQVDLGGTDYRPRVSGVFRWGTWHSLPPEELKHLLGDRLPGLLSRDGIIIEGRPISGQAHYFSEYLERFNHWNARTISALVNLIAGLSLETSEECRQVLELFDALLAMAAGRGGRGSGGFFSPPWLSTLVATIANPKAGDRVYDPCFGSASLLTACYRQAKSSGSLEIRNADYLSIHGLDTNNDSLAIGSARLTLSGCLNPNLVKDSYLEPVDRVQSDKNRFDLVVANPPWNMRVDRYTSVQFPVQTTDAIGLCILHAMSKLKEDGRAVVVVPQGVLFRGGQDQRLREYLMQRHSIEAVIRLPTGAFKPASAVVANMLILGRQGPTKRVRMVDASALFDGAKRNDLPRDDQIHSLVSMISDNQTTDQAWFSSAEELAAAGWDLTVKRRDQSGLDTIIDQLRTHTPVHRLGDCCDILSGNAIKSSELVDVPPSIPDSGKGDATEDRHEEGSATPFGTSALTSEDIPYIRIGDIRNDVVARGAKWLSSKAARETDPRWRLKAGDVLLSKSGTIGRAGIVRNRAVGAVAASGLFILRPSTDSQLDPHYLNAFLASAECKAWLQSRARGSVMNHLAKPALMDLPVPVPALQVQYQIAELHKEHGVDALTCLSQLVFQHKSDPITDWMDLALLHLKSEQIEQSHGLEPLLHAQVFGIAFSHMRNEIAHNSSSRDLATWVLTLDANVVHALRGCDDVPPGPARFALLQQAERGLQQAAGAIEGHLPTSNRARALTQSIRSRVLASVERLLESLDLQITAESANLRRNAVATIEIHLTNRGALPLRDLRVSVAPWMQEERIGFLDAEGSKTFSVSIETPKDGDLFSPTVQWSAVRMDGQSCSGVREIPFALNEEARPSTDVDADLGSSPYVLGNPISPDRSDLFVGREATLASIRRHIGDSGNVVLLEGNRRAGKSSILSHLTGRNAVKGWLGAYCSFQGMDSDRLSEGGVTSHGIYRALATAVVEAVQECGIPALMPNGEFLPLGKTLGVAKACREGITENGAFGEFREYLRAVLKDLANLGLGLLILIDEFDKVQEGIDKNVPEIVALPEQIRSLVQGLPRLSAILTGSLRLKSLRQQHWSAFYGLGVNVPVSNIDHQSARLLITNPVAGKLHFTNESIERVIEQTGCQPFLIQSLCNRIFDLAARLHTRSITLDLVEKAARELVNGNEHFAGLWDFISSHLGRLMLAMCHRHHKDEVPLSIATFQMQLAEWEIEVTNEKVEDQLSELRELELISKSSDDTYRITVPLLGLWIEYERDVNALINRAQQESVDHA